jgi:hypothetical protein
MPQMGVGAKEIFYGDFSGLHVKDDSRVTNASIKRAIC